MTDSLGEILSKGDFSEPREVTIIKNFVQEEVGVTPSVSVTKTSFIVNMPNAAAAGTLRFKLFQLQRSMGHERKIIIRIS